MGDEVEDWKDAIARDDRREAMRGQPIPGEKVPDDLKDKPWAHDMYWLLRRKQLKGQA
jgi:hypothetical protein